MCLFATPSYFEYSLNFIGRKIKEYLFEKSKLLGILKMFLTFAPLIDISFFHFVKLMN